MVKASFAVLLTVSLLGIAACDDDDDDETGTSAAEGGQSILIKTHVAPLNARGETTGEVRSGSAIGDSEFCAGGKFADAPQKTPGDPVVRTFRCSDGTLTISFTATGDGLKQSGDWKVVKGLRSFEGLSGGGRMKAVFESEEGAGRDTFTGTVSGSG
jgi:hypothetical protein